MPQGIKGEQIYKIVLVVCVLCALAVLVLAVSAAPANAETAVTIEEARARVAAAEARLSEARHVLSETKEAAELYGGSVGRWVWLSREVGWRWVDMDRLMYVIYRESRGNPLARNTYSGAAGLLQFLPSWWSKGQFDPYNPRQCLRRGFKAHRDLGWSPWGF